MYWLLGRQSQLSMANKLILYKVILKPIGLVDLRYSTLGDSKRIKYKNFAKISVQNNTINYWCSLVYNKCKKFCYFCKKIIVYKEPFYLSNKLKFLSTMRFVNIQSMRYNYLLSERHFFVFAYAFGTHFPLI